MTRHSYKAGLAPLLAAVLCAAASHSVAAAPIYTALDLGTFGGPSSEGPVFGGGLNVAGNTVGQADNGSGGYDAFLTAPNTAITAANNLGTLPGFAVSVGYGLNNHGEAVGFVDTASGDPTSDNAFVYDGTALHNLGTFGGSASDAFGINDSGTVVGGADDANGNESAFVHNGTGPLVASSDNLGTFGGNQSTAQAINNSGQVTGEAKTAAGNFNAFLHSGSGMLVSSDDLGTLEAGNAGSSQGFALNASGEVVGASTNGATDAGGNAITHAFADSAGKMTDLGTLTGDLNSFAFGVNDLGFIVGESDNADLAVGFNGARAFLDTGSGLEDLNTLVYPSSLVDTTGSYTLAQGLGINDSGQILVDGYTSTGQVHAFLLTPNASAVPEPGSLQMVCLGGLGLGLCLLRRRRARA